MSLQRIAHFRCDCGVYSGYGIGFDLRSEFSLTHGSVGKSIINLAVGMSSSMHIDNKKKDILILGKGQIQELDNTTVTAEFQHSINFSNYS